MAIGITESAASPQTCRPIRLFLMINSFETGGSERQFVILAQHINRRAFHVSLGCLQRVGPFADGLGPVPEFPLGGSLFGAASLRTRWRLSRHLREQQVLIAHAFDFYTNLTLVPAARFARVPVVVGSHRQIGDLLTPVKFHAQATVFRWCDAVVCNSHAAADRLAEHGVSRNKLAVIGNALPAEVFATVAPAMPRTPGVLRIGMVARMNERCKNHSSFLRIAARVRKQVANVEFLLIGDGPLRPELEKEAQALGLQTSVRFLGNRPDIAAVHASMDVAVLTSDSESLSNVILEAMAARLPVVAYGAGGNRELVNEQRGALVAPGDESGFADAVVHLLSRPGHRDEFGRNARRFVEENFGSEHIRNRYQELYERLLKDAGRATIH